MENTTAFDVLTQLITVVGNFFTNKFLFGFSVLQLISYVTVVGLVISIFLGSVVNIKNSRR